MKPILYIIIPCYNEQDVLPITSPLFSAKLTLLIQKEKISDKSRILFVNDGSKDNNSFLPNNYEAFFFHGILITIVLIIFMASYIIYNNFNLNHYSVILLAAWFNMTCILFIPAMHERYSYVFIVIICCCMFKRDKIYIPLLLSFVSVLTYCYFLFGASYNKEILVAINLGLWFVCGHEIIMHMRLKLIE